MMVMVGGADHGEIIFIGHDENDAVIGVLKNVITPVFINLRHNNMAALHHAYVARVTDLQTIFQHFVYPRTRCIDQHTGIVGFCLFLVFFREH